MSRRPNKRPSQEKAPGPSNASATAEMTIPNATSLTSCTNRADAGNHERAIPRKQIPISSPAIGVRNPAVNNTPPMIRTTPSIRSSEEEPDGPEKYNTPAAAAARPTATRNSNSPMPGLPPGKVEYSLCSANLPDAPWENLGPQKIRRYAAGLKSHFAASFCTTFEVLVFAAGYFTAR